MKCLKLFRPSKGNQAPSSSISNLSSTGFLWSVACVCVVLLVGCATTPDEFTRARALANQSIASEPPGKYFVGRRFYRRSYFFWGYVRQPRQPWSTARLVMLNEQRTLAPDREANAIGFDNNYEYRLDGYFSGQTVYEPASNGFYPEFVLTGYKVLSNNPPRIFRDPAATDPNRLYIDKPE
jgi:hypothetical protein